MAVTVKQKKVAKPKKIYSPEEKLAWKEERLSEQKQLLADSLAALTNSDAWGDWIRFGRSNLSRLSFNNALYIWAQRRDATIVWGAKQWEKQKVTINPDAQKLRYLAPAGFYPMKDANGNEVLDKNGKPRMLAFYRVVIGYDIKDTDAPEPDIHPMVALEGDEMGEMFQPALEGFARSLGILVRYQGDTNGADGWYDEKNSEIVMNKDLSGNSLVRTLIHELAHAYGNVNYKDFSREEAEVLVESATVMTLGMMGYDVREASVPYIASWGTDLKVLEKYAKLVDELVKKLTKEMGL